jgi:FKBP-type peptidyl-prolyl cis-trans isomerase
MTKIKNVLALIIFATIIYACSSSSATDVVDDFDYEAQALIDNDTLVKFLKNHYFDTTVDSVKTLIDGQVALFDDTSKLKQMSVTENEIDYTLYYYINNEGGKNDQGDVINHKGYPTVMDSVFVNYYGQRIVNTDSISDSFDSDEAVWWTLNGVIRGWTHGFTKFKGGNNITDNGPITFDNGGKGILFIPSGLAYNNIGSGTILANECIFFYIDLLDLVPDTDHDNDGIASINEDVDDSGDSRDDDTDLDGIPNYFDDDDDGDGVLTINEDENGDGNPANDFNDSDNPTLADYLNPDIN